MKGMQLQLPLPASPPRQASRNRATSVPARKASPDLCEAWPFEPAFAPPPEAPPRPRPLLSRNELVQRAQALATALSRHAGKAIKLHVTDNRSTMVSFRRVGHSMVIRVHRMFLDAPEPVVKAIADYSTRGTRSAGKVIDSYVRENQCEIRASDGHGAAEQLDPRGRVHQLQPIFDRLNLLYFDNAIDARIGWGRGARGAGARRRRSIRMGVYDHLTRTIRIHPALDRREVPQYFVEYIVFHEMLHQAVPGEQGGGRKRHHGPEFRAREQAYPGYERALAWEKANLGLLLGKGPRS